MAQVTLRINGYAYTLGCQDGEERHLEAMGEEVSRRIDGVRLAAGPSGEARMLVMAALLMADEPEDPDAAVDRLEAALERIARLAAVQPAASNAPPPESDLSVPEIAERLDSLIGRLRAALGKTE